MNSQIEEIKKIAESLADYDSLISIACHTNNVQRFGDKEIPVYDEVSLSHGLPAVCLLFAELSNIYPEEGWDFKAHTYMKKLQQKIQCNQVYDLSMFSGYAGIGLATDCLSKNGTRYRNFTSYINQYIREAFPQFLKKIYDSKYCFMRDYDVISGVAGILGYTILQDELKDISKKIGEYLVYRCQKIDYENEEIPGFYIPRENQFLDTDKKNFPKGNFNIGLSHGVPGILLALCLLKKRNFDIKGLDEAIYMCSDFLLGFLDTENNRWGAYVSFEDFCGKKIGKIDTRDAWCYGSPGVSYALFTSGMILHKEVYKKVAIKVMENIMNSLQGLYSPTFCHGFAGIAYIYWRFYELTKIVNFKESAINIADKIWEFYDIKNPFGFKDIEYHSHTNQIGLLSGTSGILLTLLAIYGNKNTNWDYAFMLGKL